MKFYFQAMATLFIRTWSRSGTALLEFLPYCPGDDFARFCVRLLELCFLAPYLKSYQ